MAGFKSIGHLLGVLAASISAGTSKHRKARVVLYVFRHPRAHRRLIPKLVARQQQHMRDEAARKAALRREWDRAPLAKGAPKWKQ